MEYVLVGLFVAVVAYVAYRNNVKRKNRVSNDSGQSDRNFRNQ